MFIDTNGLSDRALISLQVGLSTLWETSLREQDKGFFPIGGETNARDLDLVDELNEELWNRGNGGHRHCHAHLLPLVSPDACDGCLVNHPHPDGINA